MGCIQAKQGGFRIVERVSLNTVLLAVIAIFIVLAYFNGWGN